MSHTKTHCTCVEHKNGTPSVVNEHEFALDHDEETAEFIRFEQWRWLCSCGRRGQWQFQSDNAAYHSWLRHVNVNRKS